MRKKKMNFQNADALKTVQKVIDEAGEALNDPSRTIVRSTIPKTLAGALGAGAGGATGFAAGLGATGLTGGLAAAGTLAGGISGIAVVAAPAVALGATGVAIAAHMKNKKLREQKIACLIEAIAKQNAIIKALQEEITADKERIDYLNSLNNLLTAYIRGLKQDLE